MKKIIENPAEPEVAPTIENPSVPPVPSVLFDPISGLREGVEYIYSPDGFINWLEMVDKSEIVPNKGNFERRNKSAPSSAEGLDYKDCLILLAGFKKVARLRGMKSVRFNTIVSGTEYVDVECVIEWFPNFETGNQAVQFAAKGDASISNCDSFTKYYLSAIAENRSFVRAVRNFLNIPVLGKDEIGVTPEPVKVESEVRSSPHSILSELMAKKNISFEKLKSKMIKDSLGNAEKYMQVSDIPVTITLDVIGRISAKG